MKHAKRLAQAKAGQISNVELILAVRTNSNVLLTGPTDVTLALAHRVHRASGWRYGPFTVIDCREPDLLEERLTQACITGWSKSPGPSPRLLQAGTILLQEIGHTPLEYQPRLVHHLEELRRRGRSRCRVFASSSESLLERVSQGTFDDRLFYRLNVLHLFPSTEKTAPGRDLPHD